MIAFQFYFYQKLLISRYIPEKLVSDQQWLQAKEELETYINEEGKHVNGYNTNFYYTAVYNDPVDESKGHSEIWFLDV